MLRSAGLRRSSAVTFRQFRDLANSPQPRCLDTQSLGDRIARAFFSRDTSSLYRFVDYAARHIGFARGLNLRVPGLRQGALHPVTDGQPFFV
jgi:hypothetical protein